MDADVVVRIAGSRTVVSVAGDIDVFSAPQLRLLLVDVISTGGVDLVVDLACVDFIDSSGLGVLVGALKQVRATDGSLRLVISNERIMKPFRITNLTTVFPIHASLLDALSSAS